jgi:hypothetical protein
LGTLASIDKYLKVRKGVETPDILTSSATVYNYLKTPLVQFDTTYSSSNINLGKIYWNSSEGTLNLGISSTKEISFGEDSVYRVRNSTGSVIQKGTALYASGVEPSGRINVSPYVADGSIREVRFMGLAAESINNGINGFVQHFGYVTGLDTRGTASAAVSVGDEDWAAGDILYVHPTVPGKLTNVKPQHEITVAIIIKRHQSEGILFVRPSSAGHLEDNHDINFTTLADNDVMLYNGSASYWYNESLLAAVQNIDGVDSGIDADLLDGQQGSYYAPIDSPTFTGSVNAPEPTTASNVATKNYVDSAISSGGVVLSSASAYPSSAAEHTLFFNTTADRVAVRVGSVWKELAFVTDVPITGGDSGTLVFAGSVDGGDSSTTLFTNNYDGGES